jgi:hypothetical protein
VGVDGRACLLCDLKRTTCKGMAVGWEMSGAMAMAISMVMKVATVMRLWGFKTWLCGGQRSDQNPVRLEDSLDEQSSPSLPLPLDEGEKAGCSSSRYRLPGRAASVAPARYDFTPVRAGGKRQVGASANGL